MALTRDQVNAMARHVARTVQPKQQAQQPQQTEQTAPEPERETLTPEREALVFDKIRQLGN